MYKQLITYNLSNVETRESFEEMIEDMGFDRPDGQTAYILRARSDVSAREMKSEIVNWSECVGSYIDVEDRVDLYYVTVISGARPRDQILVLGPGPEIKYLLETYCWVRIGNKKTYRQSRMLTINHRL